MTEAEIHALIDDWNEKTGFYSWMAHRTNHETYKRIVVHGEEAVRGILSYLRERGPDHIVVALPELTGASVSVSEDDRGRLAVICAKWLRWGDLRDGKI